MPHTPFRDDLRRGNAMKPRVQTRQCSRVRPGPPALSPCTDNWAADGRVYVRQHSFTIVVQCVHITTQQTGPHPGVHREGEALLRSPARSRNHGSPKAFVSMASGVADRPNRPPRSADDRLRVDVEQQSAPDWMPQRPSPSSTPPPAAADPASARCADQPAAPSTRRTAARPQRCQYDSDTCETWGNDMGANTGDVTGAKKC
jgi:hypothetical protein